MTKPLFTMGLLLAALTLMLTACSKPASGGRNVSVGQVTSAPVFEQNVATDEWAGGAPAKELQEPQTPTNNTRVLNTPNRTEESTLPLVWASTLSSGSHPITPAREWLPLEKSTVDSKAPDTQKAHTPLTEGQRSQQLRDELQHNAKASTAWKE